MSISPAPIHLSTAYHPPIAWMALALHSGNILIEYCETYPKQSFRNRCILASDKGQQALIVPVVRIHGNHTVSGEVLLDHSTAWQQRHWRTVVSLYSRSPYFEYYRDHFEGLYTRKVNKLVEWNALCLESACQSLGVTLQVQPTVDFLSHIPSDYRYFIQPKDRGYLAFNQHLRRYMQVFEERTGFQAGLSILDLLFNTGPDAEAYLRQAASILLAHYPA